jgi:fido (protein-threonine AMPylation protein)
VNEDPLLCKPDQKQTLEIRNQAEILDYLADFVKKGRSRITEGDLLALHWLTIHDIYPCAGKFRTALNYIEITDTDHKPAEPALVKIETQSMLDWLYTTGAHESPVHRASYLMWKTCAIHPFNGGNGRVARSLAYLLVVKEIAPIFAGESLPTKLKSRKPEYIAGLQAADAGDLSQLEQLVLQCLQEQIAEVAAKPHA